MKRACVFAHFDLHNTVDDYVLYYLKCLCKAVDTLVFVTVSRLSQVDLAVLVDMGVEVIQRENIGYDFFSYQAGMKSLVLTDYDELLLCNDSVYGPFFDLEKLFAAMNSSEFDFWGITENYEYSRHIQSYFMNFGSSVFQSEEFQRFWQDLQPLDDKREIIRRYEVGLSQSLIGKGFKARALVSFEQVSKLHRVALSWRQYVRTVRRRWRELQFYSDVFHIIFLGRQIAVNPTHMEWTSLVVDHGSPFIKIELLRDNPKGVEGLELVYEVIAKISNYPGSLISNHLARISQSQKKKACSKDE